MNIFDPSVAPSFPRGSIFVQTWRYTSSHTSISFFWPNGFFFYLKMCKDCSLYFFQCKNFTLLNILNGRIFYMNSSLEPSTQVSLKCIPLHTLFVKINAQSTIIFVLGLCCEITLHHRWTFSSETFENICAWNSIQVYFIVSFDISYLCIFFKTRFSRQITLIVQISLYSICLALQ